MYCFLWLFILCSLFVSVLSRPPNIVFIMADDFGFNDIGYHAREHESDMKTPFLDHLAENGIKLENYYVQPLCSPTRSQLMSGQYNIHTGLQHGVIRPSQPNSIPISNKLLPEQLRNCGYGTHMIGKWHLGFHEQKFLPWNRGFDSYFGFLIGAEDYYTRYRCYRDFCGVDMHDSERGPINDTWGEYSAHLYTRKAMEVIDHRDPSKPFFLYLSYQSVHDPLQVPEKYLESFKHIKDRDRRIYAGMVLAMDESIRNVTQHLSASGLIENTVIVFTTDNGGGTYVGANNWPLRGEKFTFWEGGIKAVGFMHGEPLGLKGATHNGLLHISDWFPTLLGMSGCSVMNGTQPLDGFDQMEAILQKMPSLRTEILHNIDPLNVLDSSSLSVSAGFDTRVQAGIRSGNWKLLTGNPGFGEWVKPPESDQSDSSGNGAVGGYLQRVKPSEFDQPDIPESGTVHLFNIADDPYEHENVAHLHPTIVTDLLHRLAEYNATAVPVHYPAEDPNSDPKLNGGFFQPWLD